MNDGRHQPSPTGTEHSGEKRRRIPSVPPASGCCRIGLRLGTDAISTMTALPDSCQSRHDRLLMRTEQTVRGSLSVHWCGAPDIDTASVCVLPLLHAQFCAVRLGGLCCPRHGILIFFEQSGRKCQYTALTNRNMTQTPHISCFSCVAALLLIE